MSKRWLSACLLLACLAAPTLGGIVKPSGVADDGPLLPASVANDTSGAAPGGVWLALEVYFSLPICP